MTALALLCEIIALGGKVGAAPFRGGPDFATLLRHGFIREAGVIASIVCDDCDTPHAAAVDFEHGRYGYHCDSLGRVALDRIDVEAVRPDPANLVEHLFEALGCKRRKQSPIMGQTWRIGALETVAGEVMLYFHPKLQSEEDMRHLSDALSREVRARWRLIITAAGTMPLADAQTVQLDDLAEVDVRTGAFRILVEPAELLGISPKNKGGRPNRYSAILSELTAERKRSGKVLPGRNKEADALLADFKRAFPKQKPPSISTVRGHVSKSRGGQ